jgi:hypothetical protein
MRAIFTAILLSTLVNCTVHGQMKTDGEWPKPSITNHKTDQAVLTVIDIAQGDAGWFDDYLHCIIVDHNGRMWMAGQYGLAYSDNEGLSWKKSITKYAIYSIFETKNHTLLASSNNSFVLFSIDNGKTWKHQNIFDKNGPTGKSSHGERYNDIFYTQVTNKLIVRTCQYSQKLLLSEDEGKTWQIIEGPDEPTSIYAISNSLVVMFTRDAMYISHDGCKTWKKEHSGLPKPNDPMYDVIECGIVTENGKIMALINHQKNEDSKEKVKSDEDEDENETYKRKMYIFDTIKNNWQVDTSFPIYDWGEDCLLNIGNKRMMLYDFEKKNWSLSTDDGKSWNSLSDTYNDAGYGNNVGYPKSIAICKNYIFIIHNTLLARINFP